MRNLDNVLQEAFENYNFGEGVTVEASDGWESEGKDNYIKVVYVSFDDDEHNADSTKVSFHVDLEPGTEIVSDSYAFLVTTGAEIGFAPQEDITRKVKP